MSLKDAHVDFTVVDETTVYESSECGREHAATVGHTCTAYMLSSVVPFNCAANSYLVSSLSPIGVYVTDDVPVCGAKAIGAIAYPVNETHDNGFTTV